MTPVPLGHAAPVAHTGNMPHDTWLSLRNGGIGGSDAAAIMGLNRYRTPLAVWLEKTGLYRPADTPTEAMEWGSILEPVVADQFTKRTGVPTDEFHWLLAHPEHPHMLANIDRVIPYDPVVGRDGSGVYEGKTTSPWSANDWANNQVPDSAALQTHHYLAVTGLTYAWVAVLVGGQRLEWRRIERDDELVAMIVRAEHEFWRRVENNDPPQPTAADTKFLGDVWHPEADKTLVFDDDLMEALTARNEWRAAARRAEDMASKYEAELKLALGEHEYGATPDGDVICSWKATPPVDVPAHTRKASRRFNTHRTKKKANFA